jgi:hypothetical protein
MDQSATIIVYLALILIGVLFLIVVFGPKRYFGMIAICVFVLGLGIGIGTEGFPSGLLFGIFMGLLLDVMLLGSLLTRFYRENSIKILKRWTKDKNTRFTLAEIFTGIDSGVLSTNEKTRGDKTVIIISRIAILLLTVFSLLYISPRQQHTTLISNLIDFPLRLLLIILYLYVFWFIGNIFMGENGKSSRFLQFSNYQYRQNSWMWAVGGGFVAIGLVVGMCFITKLVIAHFLPEWIKWTYIAILFLLLVGGWTVIRLTLDWISWYKKASHLP